MELVVALDLPTPEENLELARSFHFDDYSVNCWFKIGFNTFIAGGPNFVKEIKQLEFPVVLDLKLYDIPNTMGAAAVQMAKLGVDMITIHASAGEQGMRAVQKAVNDLRMGDDAPKLLAVTVLTSFTHEHCIGVYGAGRTITTQRLVTRASSIGMDGVVCSAQDLPFIDEWQLQSLESRRKSDKLIKFVPGIELMPRVDDQARKGNLKDVTIGGADFIVVGRPIYQSAHPKEAAMYLLKKIGEMQGAMDILNTVYQESEESDST